MRYFYKEYSPGVVGCDCHCLHLQLPFSDFVLTNRGYLQDHQIIFPRSTMSTFGLLLADKVVGPFELEIQTIQAVRRMSTKHDVYSENR